MTHLIKIELYKVFTRPRSYIGFLALMVIVAFTQAGVYLEGDEFFDFITSNLKEVFLFQGNLVNGYLITYLVLNFLWVHIPLLVVLVTGDLFSGETHNGTFRIILSRPVSRSGLVNAKFLSGFIYSALLVIFLGLISLPPGLLLFGKGDLMLFIEDLHFIPADDLLWRFLVASAFGIISMLTVASLSLLLSSLSNNSLGPILATMAIIIVFTLISSVNLNTFNVVKPFLFTSYLNSWQNVFKLDPELREMMMDALILLLHSLIFYVATLWIFRRKNILS